MFIKGYITSPAKGTTPEGYDAKTGIYTRTERRTMERVNGNIVKDGAEHAPQEVEAEHVFVNYQQPIYKPQTDKERAAKVKPEVIGHKMTGINVYPQDGIKFTEQERKALKPGRGFNLQVNRNPANVKTDLKDDGKHYPATVYLHQSNNGYNTLQVNRRMDRKVIGEKREEAKRAGTEQWKAKNQEMSAERSQTMAAKQAQYRNWVQGLEPESHELVGVQETPQIAYDEQRSGMIMQTFPAVLENSDVVSVKIPAGQNLQVGDTISLNNVGRYTGKDGKVTLYSLDKDSYSLTSRNDPEHDVDHQPVQGYVVNAYEKNGTYYASLADEVPEQVAGEPMVKAEVKQSVKVSPEVGAVLEDETKTKGNRSIQLSGVGKPIYVESAKQEWRRGNDHKRHKVWVPTMKEHIDLTDEQGKDNATLTLNGKAPKEFLKDAAPKKEAAKAKAPAKAKTAKKSVERG